MIKLLALDMDGPLLNEVKEIPQAHISAIHQAIEKGVNWFSVRVARFSASSLITKNWGLISRMSMSLSIMVAQPTRPVTGV